MFWTSVLRTQLTKTEYTVLKFAKASNSKLLLLMMMMMTALMFKYWRRIGPMWRPQRYLARLPAPYGEVR